MRKLIHWLDCYLEEFLAGCALLVMATLVFLQVLMRYVFSAPLSWSDEIAVYCMVWSVYLSAVWAVREREHIRVLNAVFILPKSLSLVVVIASDLLWLFLAGLVAWQGVVLEASLWSLSYTSPVLGIEQKWPYLVIAVSFTLMIFRLLQCYFIWFKGGCKGLPSVSQHHGGHHHA